jgi:hypothetical protein
MERIFRLEAKVRGEWKGIFHTIIQDADYDDEMDSCLHAFPTSYESKHKQGEWDYNHVFFFRKNSLRDHRNLFKRIMKVVNPKYEIRAIRIWRDKEADRKQWYIDEVQCTIPKAHLTLHPGKITFIPG